MKDSSDKQLDAALKELEEVLSRFINNESVPQLIKDCLLPQEEQLKRLNFSASNSKKEL